LQRYSKTVLVSAALTNQAKILLAENVMLDQDGPILQVLPIILPAVRAKGFLDAACHSA
jgi:hypothetical protein